MNSLRSLLLFGATLAPVWPAIAADVIAPNANLKAQGFSVLCDGGVFSGEAAEVASVHGDNPMTSRFVKKLATLLGIIATPAVLAQPCPKKNVQYWQAFPPGGESDISARHQQSVLKKHCPAIDAIIQYKPGAGGGLMWAQMNQLPGDGFNIVGINLPHIVFQPLEGQVQYKTEDVVPVYWFHYTPDALVVRAESPYKTFEDFVKAAKAEP